MHKMMATVLTVFLLLAFSTAQAVSASSAGDGGNPGIPSLAHEELSTFSQPETDFSKGLVITLKVPRNAPFLGNISLSDIEAADNDNKSDVVTLEVPVSSDKFSSLPVAIIGEEPLTVGDYRQALEPAVDAEGKTYTVAGQDPMEVLNRYIDRKLIVNEGRESGVDTLPDVVNKKRIYGLWLLRDMLIQEQLKDVKADPEMVESLYRQGATRFRVKVALFNKDKEDLAKDFLAQLEKGRDFDELAAEFSEKYKKEDFKVGGEKHFMKRKDMLPVLAEGLDKLEIGQISSIIPMGKNYAIAKLLEKRLPNDPQIRSEAEQMALNYASNKKLEKFNDSLMKKYVTFHQDVYDSLNDVKDFEKLLKDDRVLADVKGGESLTVAGLADILRVRYFHGIQRAIDEGRFANDKALVMTETLFKRVVHLEGVARGFDKRPDYEQKLASYEDSLIFGYFLEKSLMPEVKITEEDLQNYYNEHKSEFTTPEMVSLRGLTFYDSDKAQEALDSLQKGTDLRWLLANAEGQVPPGTEGLLALDGGLVTSTTIPEGMFKALEGATPGQYRLYDDEDNKFFYVLYLQRRVPTKIRSLESVRGDVTKEVFNMKTAEALKNLVKKLRQAYGVEIYATGFNKQTL